MKNGLHPDYHHVVFADASTGDQFLTRSTVRSNVTVDYQGQTYPLVTVDVTSASHPFWTGNARVIDTQGQIQKFNQRYGVRTR